MRKNEILWKFVKLIGDNGNKRTNVEFLLLILILFSLLTYSYIQCIDVFQSASSYDADSST